MHSEARDLHWLAIFAKTFFGGGMSPPLSGIAAPRHRFRCSWRPETSLLVCGEVGLISSSCVLLVLLSVLQAVPLVMFSSCVLLPVLFPVLFRCPAVWRAGAGGEGFSRKALVGSVLKN